ncbi:MAG: sel1 repeat family protein [Opitutae bacterium]|nr:sel1 repeat family protein [Opitutae bacterium]
MKLRCATALLAALPVSAALRAAPPDDSVAFATQAAARAPAVLLPDSSARPPGDQILNLAWLEKLAAKGHPRAMFLLAKATFAADRPGALEWLQRAVVGAEPAAQLWLGRLLVEGRELPPDPERGLALLHEAAAAGFAPAQFELGRLLLRGQPGIAADSPRGVELLRAAAAAKIPEAAALLGELYETGVGVAADPGAALRWYQEAKKLGAPRVEPAIRHLQGAGEIAALALPAGEKR